MKTKRRLGLGPTLVIAGLVYLAYRIFRSPELDREIEKFAKKEAEQSNY
ncbi:hypothetical protein [Mucilaginibacter corticis]|nr:hypothetical protein [Mucilaginibacter corticis]